MMIPTTKKVFLYPEKKLYSIEDLQSRFQFTFLPQIAFETKEDELAIRAKGIEKWKNHGVSQRAEELGKKFIDKIDASYIPAVSIHFVSEKVGYGLFAEEEIPKGAYVGEYTGTIRRNNRRYLEPFNHYCYEYPVLDSHGRSYVIDGSNGNLTRFINHSFTPNLKPCYAFCEGFYHVIFLAIQQIRKKAQLTYNYGKNYWMIRHSPEELS